MPVIAVENATRKYVMGESVVAALDGVSFGVEPGEFIAVTGRSGSGKSTLLNLMGGLDRPTGGEVVADGKRLGELSDDQLADYRLKSVGFVFQFFNLMAGRSALQNVEMPLVLAGQSKSERQKRAVELLEKMGLGPRMNHKPDELSGGEQQRVSIARALAHDPQLVLADEPTGNLDSKTAVEILDLLNELRKQGKTVIMVTHDPSLAGDRLSRRIELRDGKMVDDEAR